MDSERYTELNESLDSLDSPNFVAFANGGFQLQGVNAFFLAQRDMGEDMSGVIISYTNGVQDEKEYTAALKPGAFVHLSGFHSSHVSLKYKLTAWKMQKQKQGAPFYVLFMMKDHIDMLLLDFLREKYPDRAIKIVTTIEGLASYVKDDMISMGLLYARSEKGLIKRAGKFVKGAVNYSHKRLFIQWLKMQNLYESFDLVKLRKGGKMDAVETNCHYMRLAFERAGKAKLQLPDDYYENVVLFNSQPMMEEENLCHIEEPVLASVCTILKELGYRVMVKPHPGEKKIHRYLELGFEMDEYGQGVAQEYLLGATKSKPVAIIGYASTTMFTANLLWKIPAVSMSRCVDLDSAKDWIRRMCKNFLKMYEPIQVPNNLAEFREVFCRLNSNR